jgi:outer membrane protein TolC
MLIIHGHSRGCKRYWRAIVGCWVAWLLVGCTPEEYSRQADEAAHRVLQGGQRLVLGETKDFDVAYKPYGGLCPETDYEAIAIGDKRIAIANGPATVLLLEDCLRIAFGNSRELQDRKEALYTSALALANERRSWNYPLLDGTFAAEAAHERINEVGETNTAGAVLGPTLTQRFIDGGVLTLAATVDWATDFLDGSESNIVTSLLEANFTQPLLRGAWHGFAYEELYRQERDFLFEIYAYERFRQTFATTIYTRYYLVLQQRDELANEAANIERLERAVALTEALVNGGQSPQIDLDQAQQNLLDAQVRYLRNTQDYRNLLDEYKILLGLPIQANVELDYPEALARLAEKGPQPIGLEEAQAIRVALSVRPDVLFEAAEVRDANRNVEIAANQFLPQFDVAVNISAHSEEPRDFTDIQWNRNRRFAGVVFDYPLDQTDNRDAYRLAMIAYSRALRDMDEFLDEVRLEVRRAYRELMQSRKTYELRVINVRIAKRRQKLASLEQREGQASARDVLEAEDALRRAQNGLTSSLISYTTTRMQFLATMGMLAVDERGQIYERSNPSGFDRIEQGYPYVEVH